MGGLEAWFQAELLHRIALSAVEAQEALKVGDKVYRWLMPGISVALAMEIAQ